MGRWAGEGEGERETRLAHAIGGPSEERANITTLGWARDASTPRPAHRGRATYRPAARQRRES